MGGKPDGKHPAGKKQPRAIKPPKGTKTFETKLRRALKDPSRNGGSRKADSPRKR